MKFNEAVVGIVLAAIAVPIFSALAMRKGVNLSGWDLLSLALSVAGVPMGGFVVYGALIDASKTNSNQSIVAGIAGVVIAVMSTRYILEKAIAIHGAQKV